MVEVVVKEVLMALVQPLLLVAVVAVL